MRCSEHLAGVSDDGTDLGDRVAATERWHTPTTVGDHDDLVSGVREALHDGTHRRTTASSTVGSVAGGARPGPDLAALYQDRVRRAGVGSRNRWRRSRTRRQHDQADYRDDEVGSHDPGDDTDYMGFDPQRTRTRRPSDVVYVGAAIAVAVLLLAWALFL